MITESGRTPDRGLRGWQEQDCLLDFLCRLFGVVGGLFSREIFGFG
jgi:hypothetical protein